MSKNKKTGLKVAHNLDDFIEDREVILTLADAPILEGNAIKEDVDTLENIDLMEDYKRKVAIENTKKKTYDDYDDTDIIDLGGAQKKNILPQYDEKKPEKEGFMLDSFGEYNQERLNRLEAIKSKLNANTNNKNYMSLDVTKNIASEYYSPAETKKFQIPKKNIDKKKKQNILNFLEENLIDNQNDIGTRDTQKVKKDEQEENDNLLKQRKLENYNQAVQKAAQQSLMKELENEYDELEQAIEAQRKKIHRTSTTNNVEDVIKNLMETNKKFDQPTTFNKDNVISFELGNHTKEKSDTTKQELKALNTATEFLRTVSATNKKMVPPTPLGLKDSVSGTASVVNVALPSEKLKFNNRSQNDKLELDENHPKEKPEDEEELKKEIEFLDEDKIGSGLSNALRAIREKGMLMDHSLEVTGRSKDKTYDQELSKFKPVPSDRIRLEYRDETGRLMTPKEAFRYQCYIFHGKKPGKNKLEKKRKMHENAIRKKAVAPTELPSMKALKKVQKEQAQPYIVLNAKAPK